MNYKYGSKGGRVAGVRVACVSINRWEFHSCIPISQLCQRSTNISLIDREMTMRLLLTIFAVLSVPTAPFQLSTSTRINVITSTNSLVARVGQER